MWFGHTQLRILVDGRDTPYPFKSHLLTEVSMLARRTFAMNIGSYRALFLLGLGEALHFSSRTDSHPRRLLTSAWKQASEN